jgi:hypothetical protein
MDFPRPREVVSACLRFAARRCNGSFILYHAAGAMEC